MGKRLRCGRRGAWNTVGTGLKLRDTYFNHHVYKAESRWQRREFVGKWRRIYARDPRWTPPHAPSLRRELRDLGDSGAHLIYVNALPTSPTRRGSRLESTVAAVMVRQDHVKRDVGYLSFLHTVNDRTTLRVLLESLSEHLRPHGIRTLIGPTHLLPYLGSGVLANYWNLSPPLYTPYNPPYLNELCQVSMRQVDDLQLYHLSTGIQMQEDSPAALSALEPERLADDLLPLLRTACSANPTFPPPNRAEAERLLRWLAALPLSGWLAEVEGEPVGFALLQPDSKPPRTNLLSRLRLNGPQEVKRGRLLFLGVLPEFRRRGIARHLLSSARTAALERGWEALSLGPIPHEAGQVVEAWGASAQQRYTLYRYTL